MTRSVIPRSLMVVLALAATVLGPMSAAAQALRPGTDYTVLRLEQPVESDDRIEVVELFWYGCIHCYNLEPHVEAWLKTLPPDVRFVRLPAVFNERWAHDAALYYAFEALGLVERLHRPLFDAIHRERLRTDNIEALRQWLQRQGVEADRVLETMRSFGVQARVRRAAQLTSAYRIDGTPAMAVHGRYTVSAEQARSFPGMLETVDRLVVEVRRARAKK